MKICFKKIYFFVVFKNRAIFLSFIRANSFNFLKLRAELSSRFPSHGNQIYNTFKINCQLPIVYLRRNIVTGSENWKKDFNIYFW